MSPTISNMLLLFVITLLIIGPARSLSTASSSSVDSPSSFEGYQGDPEPPNPHDLQSACGHPLQRVIGKLGKGNTGTTWLVDLVDLGPHFALKINHSPHGALHDDDEHGDTMAEKHLSSNPYGVKVHAVCVQEGFTMVIMEYAEGPTVWGVISHHEQYEHLLQEAKILETYCQILEGAIHIHKNLCTHGDLISFNVVITVHGPRIIDYEEVECFENADNPMMKQELRVDGGDLAVLLVEMMTKYAPEDEFSKNVFNKMVQTYKEGITDELRSALVGAGLDIKADEQKWRADPTELYDSVCIKKPKLFKESSTDNGDYPTQMGKSKMPESEDQL